MPSPKVAYFPRPDTTTTARPAAARPVTWQPRARIPKGFGNSSFGESDDDEQETNTIRRSLIPDYVINYLRGDTPETIAQRAQEKQEQPTDEPAPTSNGLMHFGDTDHTDMPSPGYRTSEEPILRHGRGTYTYGIYSEKRRSVRSNGRRRAQCSPASVLARGWRAGMAVHALVALVLFIAGLVGLALALTTPHDSATTTFPGQAVVASCTQSLRDSTPCPSAYRAVWVLRAVLAVCTLAILAGAQYTLHILGSPTRAEVDTAHAGTPTGLLSPRRNRHWLDIGVPSLRNIVFLLRHAQSAEEEGGGARVRAVLAIVAVAAALATSVLYGALVDVTVSTPLSAQQETVYSTTVNASLLAVALGLNVVTIACFAVALLRSPNPSARQTPLITLGDAVASFLRDPDHTTRGACLLSKTDVKNGVWDRMADVPQLAVKTGSRRSSGPPQSTRAMGIGAAKAENIMQPMFLAPKAGDSSPSYYWFRSVSRARWLTGAIVWLVLAGFAAAGLAVSVPKSNTLGSLGQLAVDDDEFVWGMATSSSAYATLVASLPQLGVGLLYLVVDAHFCSYFLSHESASYIANQNIFDDIQLQQALGGRKALRVSYRPRGHQTTSFYLTLPHVWHWLLLLLFAGLSFALGQSVVVTSVASSTDRAQLVLLGFNVTGFVISTVLLLLTAVLVLGLGARRTPPPPGSLAVSAMRAASSASAAPPVRRNPLTMPGGSCSAVISARCHPLPEDMPTETTSAGPGSSSTGGPLPLWLRPLAWGPAPSYQHPYRGYNRRHVQPHAGDDGEDDTIDTIVGHCTFSNGPLVPLDTARSYA